VRVLIVGDFYQGLADPDAAKRAIYALGRCLARDGNELIACTDTPDTADREFVTGALESGNTDFHLTLYSPRDVSYPFQDLIKGRDDNVEYEMSPFADWEIVHMEAIQSADVIILVGGAGEWHYVTKMLGLASIALRKIVVPIATFGGEAGNVWSSLASSPMRESYRVIGLELNELNSPWREGESETEISGMISEAYRKRAMSFSPTRLTKAQRLPASLGMAFALFALAATVWFLLLFHSLNDHYPLGMEPLFGLAVLGGGLGSATNSIYSLWRGESLSVVSQLVSLLVGVSGGLIAFILYLLGQLVFSGEVLTNLADKPAFMRSALVATFFGIFAGLFAERGYDLLRRRSDAIVAGLEPKSK